MWVAVVGSRSLALCTCETKVQGWPPKVVEGGERLPHYADCRMMESWLLALKVVGKISTYPGIEGIVSGGAAGADTFAKDAAVMLGLKVLELRPDGKGSFVERAFRRNQKIVDKAAKTGGWVVALFGPGPRSTGTSDTIARAKAAGLKTNIHELVDGRWQWVTA